MGWAKTRPTVVPTISWGGGYAAAWPAGASRIARDLCVVAAICLPATALASTSGHAPLGLSSLAPAASPEHKSFNVRDFGAVGDGRADDQPPINKALAAADSWTKSGSGRTATVLLPRGVYDLTHLYGLFAINIVNMHDVSLEGERCADHASSCVKLIGAPAVARPGIKGPVYNSFIRVVGSRNVAVRNLYLDKKVPYFVQGMVQAADPLRRTVDVMDDPRFMRIGDPLVRQLMNIIDFFSGADTSTWDHDAAVCGPDGPKGRASHSCTNFHIVATQLVAPRLWRLTLDKPPSPRFTGKPFLIWKNLGWQWGIYVENAENVAVENIFYTGGGGPAVHVRSTSGSNLVSNLTVDVPAGSGRLFSATSGLNGGKNRGALLMQNVTVKHVDDDSFHLSAGMYYPAIAQADKGKVARLALCYPGDFRPGDHVTSLDWASKSRTGEAVVVRSDVVADTAKARYPRLCDVTLDRPLPPLANMATYDPQMLGRSNDKNARLINLSMNGSVTIENSYFSSMRAHCGILQVSGAFRNNICANTPYEGLLVGPEYQWGEGYAVSNLTIENNIFDNIGGTAISIVDQVDSVHSASAADITSGQGSLSLADNTGITIEGNRFTTLGAYTGGYFGLAGVAITVQNADTVAIRGNSFDTTVVQHALVSRTSVRNLVLSNP